MKTLIILFALACPAPESEKPAAKAPSESTRPNIILILADDVGRLELGAYGSETGNTPNLDTLASQGITFTRT